MRLVLITLALLSLSAWGQTMKDLSHPDKVKFFFDKLSKDNIGLVDEFYAANVNFIDPIGGIKGAEKVKTYYANMYKNVQEIKFDFTDFIVSGDQVVAVWKMTLKTDKLNGGEAYGVDGNSVIKFNAEGKATYHRDYFDMGDFIYERIPVVSFIVKKIKAKMKAD